MGKEMSFISVTIFDQCVSMAKMVLVRNFHSRFEVFDKHDSVLLIQLLIIPHPF